jgi:hypothetical protein
MKQINPAIYTHSDPRLVHLLRKQAVIFARCEAKAKELGKAAKDLTNREIVEASDGADASKVTSKMNVFAVVDIEAGTIRFDVDD